MTLKITILGCGSSGGVPRPALGWGACDPDNPKNRRRRTSILVERESERGKTRVLVDTPPDLREQLLAADVDWVDAVLYTHDHADHTHGIDDLRALFIKRRRRVDVYLDEATSASLNNQIRLLLHVAARQRIPADRGRAPADRRQAGHRRGGGRTDHRTADPARARRHRVARLSLRQLRLLGRSQHAAGDEESKAALADLDVWIVDALRERQHPSHFSVSDALGWIERLKPRRAILTNLHSDLDYEALRGKLPVHVVPAFDGMTFDCCRSPLIRGPV